MTVQHSTNTSSNMSSSKFTPPKPNSLYPEVILTNPDSTSPFLSNTTSTSSSFYPAMDTAEVAGNLFPEDDAVSSHTSEEVMVKIPGAMLHLIEKDNSVELACGDLSVVGLRQGSNIVAVLARIGDEIQWPLAKDEAAVKLDDSHYFFTLRVPNSAMYSAESGDDDGGEIVSVSAEQFEVLNYGLTIASKGQGGLLKDLDTILETYSCFSTGTVAVGRVLDGAVARETTAEEKRERMRESSAAYWTTLAPNVEDYGGRVAEMIAAGTGQLAGGILWCGDVTVDRLKWGDEFLRKRMGATSSAEVCPRTLRRIKRVKKLTMMSENVSLGILSGVVKVSGFFTSSIVNSYVGEQFFSLLPGEIVLASLDGFSKVCDAIEVAGRNVMSTTSVVTSGLLSQRYGEQAGKVTNEGLDAAGHVIGTAWAVFNIRKALNPKSVIKPTTLAKAAAEANSSQFKAKTK